MIISSVNSLVEILKNNGSVNRVLISRTKRDHKIAFIKKACAERGIIVQFVPKEAIDRKCGTKDNQGVFAETSPVSFYSVEEIIESAAENSVVLMLDSINDTGNLGAIVRTAAAAGVAGIIMSERNSAPVNETVLKTSAGTLGSVKIARAKNMSEAVKTLKDNGFWIAATGVHKGIPYYNFNFKGKIAVVMGNENKGVSPVLLKNADEVLLIPHSEKVESLNVSAATAVVIFEALRQQTPGK